MSPLTRVKIFPLPGTESSVALGASLNSRPAFLGGRVTDAVNSEVVCNNEDSDKGHPL